VVAPGERLRKDEVYSHQQFGRQYQPDDHLMRKSSSTSTRQNRDKGNSSVSRVNNLYASHESRFTFSILASHKQGVKCLPRPIKQTSEDESSSTSALSQTG
jgi:hypothetical protein